ncbi:hypothetical protein MLD38_030476 [Melastoma candidum]|uniref:Uncharacterized protein n=1 Tax=Melastoma candidum TaxID=119954 RepID=A0ACB9MLB0_9MYRT|nr:hypothetical protein MLD38_030476 [Melastoma candidum]
MEEEESGRPVRLMNFVSEEQLQQSKRSRGERVEDGTAQRDRPLYEILKENKDKRDAEFNERFKHRPPKALDEDETEFLDKLERSRRDYERRMADEEEEQLRSFQAAVAAQVNIVHELKEPAPREEDKPVVKKRKPAPPLGMIVKVKPQAKKANVDPQNPGKDPDERKTPGSSIEKPSQPVDPQRDSASDPRDGASLGLVSYSDDSEDEL